MHISLSRSHFFYLTTILLLMLMSFYSTFSWMYNRYTAPDSYYSHGIIIPFVSGYLIWRKWSKITLPPSEYSWWGLWLVVIGIFLHTFGTLFYIFTVSGIAFYLILLGGALFLLGRKNTKTILFPLIFLVFMLPIPIAVIDKLSFPLKMSVAGIAITIVRLLGIPVYREGFFITIPAGTLLVGNPCSGLRSLIAFMALGAILAYMCETKYFLKWILFFTAIPVALLSNIIRVVLLILISHYLGLESAAPDSIFHTGTGILIFIIGFVLLFFLAKIFHGKN